MLEMEIKMLKNVAFWFLHLKLWLQSHSNTNVLRSFVYKEVVDTEVYIVFTVLGYIYNKDLAWL